VIEVETHPNRHYRTYHTTFDLAPPGEVVGFLCEGRMNHPSYRQLSVLPGVTDVTIDRYSVGIVKGNAFDWSDIEPEIKRTIESFESKVAT
jgi:hypothetical protein